MSTLDRLIRREEERDPKAGDVVSDELKKAIDRTKARIRAAFADGSRKPKASLKKAG